MGEKGSVFVMNTQPYADQIPASSARNGKAYQSPPRFPDGDEDPEALPNPPQIAAQPTPPPKAPTRFQKNSCAAARPGRSGTGPLTEGVADLTRQVGVQLACRALPVSRASYYRHRKKSLPEPDTAEAEPITQASRRRGPEDRAL